MGCKLRLKSMGSLKLTAVLAAAGYSRALALVLQVTPAVVQSEGVGKGKLFISCW